MPFRLALIEVLPGALPVARPVLVTVATVRAAEAQATWLVRSCVELSEKVPVAVNCCVVPAAMVGLAGVTAIDRRVWGIAAVTVTVPDMPLAVPLPLSDPW